MKVILLKDVKSVGKKGEIIEANDGYARNYLLPKKIGLEANAKNLNDLKLHRNNEKKVAIEQLEEAREFAELLEKKSVTLHIRGGENGRTFGSVSTKEIAAAFKEQCGLDIDKKKIQLPESIKNFGAYNVNIKLHPEVTGVLHVKVQEEK